MWISKLNDIGLIVHLNMKTEVSGEITFNHCNKHLWNGNKSVYMIEFTESKNTIIHKEEKKNMMEKDKIEQFMVYGIEKKVSIKEVIRNEMVFLFIAPLFIFAEGKGLGFFIILILLPAFFTPYHVL